MCPRKAKPTLINGYFVHLTNEYDILRMVERFVEENSEPVTTVDEEKWAKNEILLLQALSLYLFYGEKKKERSVFWLYYTLSKAIHERGASYLDSFLEDIEPESKAYPARSKYIAFRSFAYPIEKAVIAQAHERLGIYIDELKNDTSSN